MTITNKETNLNNTEQFNRKIRPATLKPNIIRSCGKDKMTQVQLSTIRRRQSGNTLIELMIVVAIIAIITAIILPNFTKPRANSQAVASQANMKGIATAIELYYQDNHSYPASGNVSSALFGTNAAEYLQTSPISPGPGAGQYAYTLSSDGTSYTITDPATYPSSTLATLTQAAAAPANGQVTLGTALCQQACSNIGYSNQGNGFGFGSANGQ